MYNESFIKNKNKISTLLGSLEQILFFPLEVDFGKMNKFYLVIR